ncbi:Uma2 family endonuclease [Laspinema olomoucense]|uniref:Uma2 family endonuclease n=1 Tax=Laspinema olomoucense D3b TaxID=2953688 RepID=A0ABT2N9G9_9CYAN|nr:MULTISPECIES: Uma2 family endonuclease [unclassified Laspinema]MCT7971777.1 Uma2 family endonuclease [Laspinema sp. D3d]MCT7979344.1 Uma2 family endonuclease [Laspinema sp. D3b]
MTTQLAEKIIPLPEQRLILPGYQSWQEFKAIQALMDQVAGVRISYLDGCVELMTTGEQHETIKTIIGFLLQLYFCEMGMEYIPVGNATRESETKGVSFEPDESYYIGDRKSHPDLAIEVVITSGNPKKLEKYKRFEITEVWFWENNQLALYRFRGDDYEQILTSELFPDLNIELLVRCVQMPSRIQAHAEFVQGIHRQ